MKSLVLLFSMCLVTIVASNSALAAKEPDPCRDASNAAIDAARDYRKAARTVRGNCTRENRDCETAESDAAASADTLFDLNQEMLDICGESTPPPPPPPSEAPTMHGDLVINEVMTNPSGDPVNGEWIEFYNPTSTDFELNGIGFRVDSGETIISGSLIVLAGGYVVIGKSTDTAVNGGANVDYAASFQLPNSGFILELFNGTTIIDSVDFSSQLSQPGAARQLDPIFEGDADANDASANWCDATVVYGSGGAGSPKSANEPCI